MREAQPMPIGGRIALAAGLIFLAVASASANHADSLLGDPTAPWAIHLQVMDDALKIGDVSAARRAWHEAYRSAWRTQRWEGLVEVADAHLRVGLAAGEPEAAAVRARPLYLRALLGARGEGSLMGVLRATEAFATLGDRDVVERGLRLARELAARHPDGTVHSRVRALAARLAEWPRRAETHGR